jgi:predicted GIY-YIG superfamily endonuclease
MYYVYILKLYDGSYYVGYTENLKQRIGEHNRGIVKTTSSSLPITLVFYSAFIAKIKALQFERYLKEGSGFAFRNKHLI